MKVNEVLDRLSGQKLFLFITATPPETNALFDALTAIDGESEVLTIYHEANTYNVGKLGIYNVVHVQCNSMGSRGPGSSITTTGNAIDTWHPDAVIMVGIAFGKSLKIGDILISREVIDYENVKHDETTDVERGLRPYAGPILVDRFSQFRGWNYEIKGQQAVKEAGAILSGEKLLNNKDKRDEYFKRFPHAIGGEMESFGVYSACTNKGIAEWIMIKAVCDHGENKDENKEQNQTVAAKSAISLCKAVFSQQVFDDILINQKRIGKKL